MSLWASVYFYWGKRFVTGTGGGQLLSLRHPKTDGCLYPATPVDPVFIMLSTFDKARMKKGGKFRQLEEIIYIDGYPGYQHLLSIAEKSMQVVCDIKEIVSSKFFRLDDSKVKLYLPNSLGLMTPKLIDLTEATKRIRCRN